MAIVIYATTGRIRDISVQSGILMRYKWNICLARQSAIPRKCHLDLAKMDDLVLVFNDLVLVF